MAPNGVAAATHDDSDPDGDRDDCRYARADADKTADADLITAAAPAPDGSECNDCDKDNGDDDCDAANNRMDRLALIFVRLYALRGIDADTIESLFFANLIGQVHIDNVVPYILKLGGAGVSVSLCVLCKCAIY